ncbi:Zn-dependent protease with chaperone function [Labedaea rhizosphaerae]|uniref:Zn-dependent protease with chaperone function n=1 Tax=Labedaea rhizosphaerae TaxID=598644 RepID=A0A4R6SB05_LABRH|nr:Zn-dependent protease with chaperone function [Labedaea rhizosphaerae]
MGRRLAESLFRTVTVEPFTVRRRGAALWAACVIAALVHLFVVALAVFGVWIMVAMPNLITIPLGVVMLGFAAMLRPRFGRLPADAVLVSREQSPHLYAALDELVDRLGTRKVAQVVLSAEHNASITQVGLRRRLVLVLGYPLWNLLTGPERAAVLGHELAHQVNGDLRRGLLVGSSLRTLAELVRALRTRSRTTSFPIVTWASEGAMWLLSWPVYWVLLAQNTLLARSGQRAEYLADHLSATATGPAAMASALRTVALGPAAVRALHSAVIRKDDDLWLAGRTWFAELSPERKQLTDAEDHRVDDSHPPTRLRIAALQARRYPPGLPPSFDHKAIDAELAPRLKRVAEQLKAEATGW